MCCYIFGDTERKVRINDQSQPEDSRQKHKHTHTISIHIHTSTHRWSTHTHTHTTLGASCCHGNLPAGRLSRTDSEPGLQLVWANQTHLSPVGYWSLQPDHDEYQRHTHTHTAVSAVWRSVWLEIHKKISLKMSPSFISICFHLESECDPFEARRDVQHPKKTILEKKLRQEEVSQTKIS